MKSDIVDSHQHFWQVGLFDYPWMSEEVETLYRDYLPQTLEPILDLLQKSVTDATSSSKGK
jgi:predicted TIM-barrel fold metal-dependent hydrolase